MNHTSLTYWIMALVTALSFSNLRADRPGSQSSVLDGVRRAPQNPAVGQHDPRGTGQHGSGHRSWSGRHPLWPWPLYTQGGWFVPGWSYPGGIYYVPRLPYGEYYLPPAYAPAELYYGPRAVERFLGIGAAPGFVPPAVNVVPPAVNVPRAPDDAAVGRNAGALADKLRKSNAAARERARRLIEFGDALFLREKYHEAGQRYRSAIEAAADLPEAYYRQGFALVATKQYRPAAKALRIAVELAPEMLLNERLRQTLYGDNRLTQAAHVEQLAEATIEEPDNGDLYFLIGACLYGDGEGDRAVRFLQRAAELAGPDAAFLTPLLAPPPDADEPIVDRDT
jgi:hypothetical protein